MLFIYYNNAFECVCVCVCIPSIFHIFVYLFSIVLRFSTLSVPSPSPSSSFIIILRYFQLFESKIIKQKQNIGIINAISVCTVQLLVECISVSGVISIVLLFLLCAHIFHWLNRYGWSERTLFIHLSVHPTRVCFFVK